MKVVFSYCPNQPPFAVLNDSTYLNVGINDETFLDILKLGNYFAKKSGFTTAIVTNSSGYPIIKDIDFDEVHTCPHEFENDELSNSVIRLHAFSIIKEKFLFCHPSVLLTNNTILDYLKNAEDLPIIFSHENFNTEFSNKKRSNIICIFDDFINHQDIRYVSYNTKFTIVNDYESINKVSSELIDFIIKNKETILMLHNENYELFYSGQVNFRSDLNYIITTIWFQQMLQKYSINCKTLFDINDINIYKSKIKSILETEAQKNKMASIPFSLIKDLDYVIAIAMYKKYGIYCAEILSENEIALAAKFNCKVLNSQIQF